MSQLCDFCHSMLKSVVHLDVRILRASQQNTGRNKVQTQGCPQDVCVLHIHSFPRTTQIIIISPSYPLPHCLCVLNMTSDIHNNRLRVSTVICVKCINIMLKTALMAIYKILSDSFLYLTDKAERDKCKGCGFQSHTNSHDVKRIASIKNRFG